MLSASAMAAGLAHGQVVTNSQIIYSYANINVGTAGGGYAMDLNQDGDPDFQLHFNANAANKPFLDTSSYLGQPVFTPSVLAGSGDGLPVTTNGTSIDSSYESPAEYGYFYQNGSATVVGDWNSGGTDIQGYVGLALRDQGNNLYYGWAQFVYNSATVFDGNPGKITLIDYAFDQNPGEAILAGENAPPGSPPKVVVPPVSQTNGVQTTVQFTVIGSGNPYPTYQWLAETNGNNTYTPLADGGPISGSQSNVLTIAGLTPGFAGRYMVQLSNSNGVADSVPVTLTVPPLIITGLTPASLTVFPGATASIYVTYSSGAPILSYEWLKDGSILHGGGRISGTTSSNLVISALSTTDTGNYSVIVSNMFGAATSAVDVVTVILPSNPYEQQVYWTQPASYYTFNETNNDPASGTAVALDYIDGANGLYGKTTENGYPAANITGPNPAGGFLGFAATNSAVAITNPILQAASVVRIPPLNLYSNSVTFTMWIYPAQTEAAYTCLNSYRSPVAGTASGMGYSGSFGATTSSTLGFHWNDAQYNWDSGLTVPVAQWSFIALVISPTTNNAVEYVFNVPNGMQSATNNYTNNVPVQAINTPGFIGGDTTVDPNFIGNIDEVAIYKQSLTQTQLTNLWTAALTGVVTPPSATLSIQPSGANVVISWNPPVGMLLQAPSLNGPWTTNSAASSPYTNTPSGSAMFYRVVAP